MHRTARGKHRYVSQNETNLYRPLPILAKPTDRAKDHGQDSQVIIIENQHPPERIPKEPAASTRTAHNGRLLDARCRGAAFPKRPFTPGCNIV